MILTGDEIATRVRNGDIIIDPFDPARVNPNSYNLRLADTLMFYKGKMLDCKKDNPVFTYTIPETGWLMAPNILYLGRTMERTHTKTLVPMLEGRSSLARLGISVHLSAGFGDIGFNGYWTLEMTCVHPVQIYAGMEICQIFFCDTFGLQTMKYNGKYQNNNDVQSSKLFTEFPPEAI